MAAYIVGVTKRGYMNSERNVATDSLKEHSAATLVPDMRPEEWSDFYNDVVAVGIRVPIEVLGDGTIVDGRHRWRAAREAGLPEVPVVDAPLRGDDPEVYMLKAAVLRRHLTDDQRGAIADAWAQEHKQPGPGRGHKRRDDVVPSLHPTRTAAQEMFGVTERKVKDAAAIRNAAPELAIQVRGGDLTMREARTEINRREMAAMPKVTLNVPTGKFSTIVVDPPWDMQKIERDVAPNQTGFDYPTMTREELLEIPVAGYAHDNAHLYLWTTHKHLPLAFELVERWGFKYECLLTWVKNVGFAPYSWMRSTEHVLFCRKGNLKLLQMGKRVDFNAKRREHSRKPDEFYELVKEVSPGPRLDMFGREDRDGFQVYGNEPDKFNE